MFVLESSPWFVIPFIIAGVAGVILFLVLGICISFDDQGDFKNKRSVIRFIVLLVFAANSAGIGIYGASQSNSVKETFNNPYSVNETERGSLKVDASKVESTIEESLKIDKAQIDISREAIIGVKNGDITNFEAVQEGKIIDGKFYFTENSLEILTTGESEIVEHVSIPTDE